MNAPRTANAVRIFSGLISGPGSIAYVRQGNMVQTPNGPVAGSLDLNFVLAMQHSIQILESMEAMVDDSDTRQEIKRRNDVTTGATTSHCQHGTPWGEVCSACRTGWKGDAR